jgi:hypothetical protein
MMHLYGRPRRTTALARQGTLFLSGDSTVRLQLAGDSATIEATVANAPAEGVLRRAAGNGVPGGEWNTRVGPGGVFRLGVRTEPGPCGLLVGTFDSPDQGQRDLPLTHARVVGDTLHVGASYMDLALAIPLTSSAEVQGLMIQHGRTTPVTVRRGPAEQRRPQEPREPFPYARKEVEFASRAGNRIAGTLTLPHGPGPYPAIIMISGSGSQDRDQQVAGHRPFLVLGDHLTRLGFAVLRTDDRGVGRSEGSVIDSDLHDIAQDVRGGMDFLSTVREVDAGSVGLLGHSEGGVVAPIVAADDARVRFMILLGAPAHPGRDLLLMQRAALMRGRGRPAAEVRVDSAMLATIFRVLDTELESATMSESVERALGEWQGRLGREERGIATRLLAARDPAADSQSVALWRTRWFRGLFRHDPAPFLQRTHVPVFALVGVLDLQVPALPTLERFRSLYAGSRASLLSPHSPAGVNHMLQPALTGTMDEYGTIETTIAPSVFALLDGWLAATLPASTTKARTARQ